MKREGHVRRMMLLVAAAALAIATACSSDDGGSTVPSGPFDGTSGAELYAQACATCHGADLRGTENGPPFLDRIYEPGHHPDVAFMAAAMMGARAHHWDFGNMPPIEGITEEQIQAIIDYVRAEQRAAGVE